MLCIVSGGQTGVDRAALDAGIEAGVRCGGWCPAGRMAEDGPIAARYPLREMSSSDPADRTRRNVDDSDGTLVLDFDGSGPGTRLTVDYAARRRKPLLLIDAGATPCAEAAEQVLAFVRESGVTTLNVAGPRASEAPAAYSYTRHLLGSVLHAGI